MKKHKNSKKATLKRAAKTAPKKRKKVRRSRSLISQVTCAFSLLFFFGFISFVSFRMKYRLIAAVTAIIGIIGFVYQFPFLSFEVPFKSQASILSVFATILSTVLMALVNLVSPKIAKRFL